MSQQSRLKKGTSVPPRSNTSKSSPVNASTAFASPRCCRLFPLAPLRTPAKRALQSGLGLSGS